MTTQGEAERNARARAMAVAAPCAFRLIFTVSRLFFRLISVYFGSVLANRAIPAGIAAAILASKEETKNQKKNKGSVMTSTPLG